MILDNGNVLFSHSLNYVCDRVAKTESYTHHSNVILPPSAPKYDPCRRLKKGDKVKPCSWRNRGPLAKWGATRIAVPDTRVFEVMTDELHEHVALIYGDDVIEMYVCFLELVTPVEETEPYFLFEDTYSWQVKRENKLCCRYGKSTHPHAKEAAEAERDRLNKEYRKGVCNG